jgi:hypothetical protein
MGLTMNRFYAKLEEDQAIHPQRATNGRRPVVPASLILRSSSAFPVRDRHFPARWWSLEALIGWY